MFAQQCILGTLDKFETSLFTLNKKCFLFTLRIKQSLMILSFCLRKARAVKSRDLSLSHHFRKYFSVHVKTQIQRSQIAPV